MMKNKVVIITGASSGIGAVTALTFAREGAILVITYKSNKSGAQKIAAEIKNIGAKVLIVRADLTRGVEAKMVVDKAVKAYGRVDVLVNNAGRYIAGDEWDGDVKTWTKSLEQNLISVMSVSKHVINVFQKQKTGVIVSVASRFSVQGTYDALTYSVAKAGIVNLTQSYAKLLAPFGRVNAVSPGAANAGYWLTAPKDELRDVIKTIPLGKLIDPQDIAEIILFLSSDKAKNITGQNILVDGGFCLK